MKTKIVLPMLAVSALVISMATSPAQPAVGFGGSGGGGSPNSFVPGAIDPATGMPVNPAGGFAAGPGHGFFTPGTAAEPWKDENWKDPAKTLAEVEYDGLPLSEVASELTKQFTNAFDVLLPQDWEGSPGEESHEWLSTIVHLRLKNVAASEVFNAMNLTFENNRTPLRWVLKMNGRRPVALLRVVQPARMEFGIEHRTIRRVIYVGDLMGDGKSGMTMDQIIKTVSDVYQMSFNRAMEGVQFHKDAQLLIVTGTSDQLDLITQTLAAMKQKIGLEHSRMHYLPGTPAEIKPAPEYPAPQSPK